MRIVGGSFKGRPIVVPKGQGTRPTTDRTRESLFNILAHRAAAPLEEARVIDLFAGSGALGFEAISRGAEFCLFVETAAGARAAIRQNQETLGLTGVTRVHRRSATSLGPKPAGMGGAFTLCFLDPPYGQGLVDPALAALKEGAWLAPGATLVIEQRCDDPPPSAPDLCDLEERPFGDTMILLARWG